MFREKKSHHVLSRKIINTVIVTIIVNIVFVLVDFCSGICLWTLVWSVALVIFEEFSFCGLSQCQGLLT